VACIFTVLSALGGDPPAHAALAPPPLRLAHIFDRPVWQPPPAAHLPFPIRPAIDEWDTGVVPVDATAP
jgi:hypothetical protein